jgi:hypothetical protein
MSRIQLREASLGERMDITTDPNDEFCQERMRIISEQGWDIESPILCDEIWIEGGVVWYRVGDVTHGIREWNSVIRK